MVWEAKAEGRNLRKRRGCYQSNRLCGPIQGDMKANSKVQRLKAKGHKPEAEARSRKSEDGGQKSEDGRQKAGGGGLPLPVLVRWLRAGAFGDRLRRSPGTAGRPGTAGHAHQCRRIRSGPGGRALEGCNDATYLQNAGVWTSSAVLTGRGQPGGLEDLGVLARDATTPARHFDAIYQVDQGGYPPACRWACKRRSGGIRLAKGVTNPSCAATARAGC